MTSNTETLPDNLASALRSAAAKVLDAELRDWLMALANGDTASTVQPRPEEVTPCCTD